MNAPFTYKVLKWYVWFGLHIYFKKWQNANRNYIPESGPFIFVANHQNAFLDALLVVCGLKRNPWFLARGDVFKSSFAVKMLSFLRIKPIYRFRDGHSSMRKNEGIFTECVNLLKKGECVLIFGEGNHNEPWTYQNLQRGFAHLALQYYEETKKDIAIIPVGIHYTDHDKFRARVLVNYGAPVSVHEIVGDIQDTREKYKPLQITIGEHLKYLLLTIPLDEDYEAKKNYLKQNRVQKSDMIEQLEADRDLMSDWKKGSGETGNSKKDYYNWFNPLFLLGRILHLIPQAIMNFIVTRKIKDNQFIGSIKFTVGLFLIPLYYLLSTALFLMFTKNIIWALAFFLMLPVSGLVSYNKE